MTGSPGWRSRPATRTPSAAAIQRALRLVGDPSTGMALRVAARATAERHDVRRSAEASLAWYGTLRR